MASTSDSLSDNPSQLAAMQESENERRLQNVVALQKQVRSFSFKDVQSQAAFLQQLIDLIPLGIVVHIKGTIVMANPAALAILKAENLEKWIGRSALDFVHPDSRAQAVDRIQQLLVQSASGDFDIVPFVEETLLTVDGEPFEAEVAGIRMAPMEGGTPILVLFRDITEQKQQRRALEESETRFRQLVRLLPDGIVIHKNKKIVFVNEAFLGMMHVEKPERLIGRAISDFLLPEERDFVEQRIQRLLTNWEALPLSRNHIVRPDGGTFLAEVRAFPFDEKGEKAVLLAIRDVTEMEKMRQELEKNEAKFRLLAELLPAMVYMVGEHGDIIYMNQSSHEMLGYSFEEIQDMDLFEIINQQDLFKGMRSFASLEVGESTYDELRARDKAGKWHWLAVWTTKALMEDQMVGLGVVLDITWRKEMEQALKEHTHRLVTALEEERRRIASELHDEVGQQLIGMKFAMERALHHTLKPEARASIQDALQQLAELTDQVREMSLSFRPTMLDNLGLLPTLLWHFKRYSARTGIQVQFNHVGLDEVEVSQIHSITIYRVIQEALTNIARHAQTDKALIEIRIIDNRLLLTIRDDGVGFNPEKVMSEYASSGLRVMQERIHLLSGKMRILTTPGKGVTIHVSLPLHVVPPS